MVRFEAGFFYGVEPCLHFLFSGFSLGLRSATIARAMILETHTRLESAPRSGISVSLRRAVAPGEGCRPRGDSKRMTLEMLSR